MKNITLAVDDQTYRAARRVAAERDTSVSSLVREFLQGLARGQGASDAGTAAEKRQRLRLVDLLEQCQIGLTERPTRESFYTDRRFH